MPPTAYSVSARRALAALAAAALTLVAAAAFADQGGGLVPVPRPPAPPGDGAKAEQILKDIAPRADHDPRVAAVVRAPRDAAKLSLERAQGALNAGDKDHARMLFGLALEWAETARDLERAAEAERASEAAAKSASAATTQEGRARALLGETQARRARAAAELDRAEGEAKDAGQRAAEAEQQRIDASKAPHGKGAGKAPPSAAGKDAAAPKPRAATKGSP